MKGIITTAASAALISLALACSVPDDPNWNDLQDSVSDMPEESRDDLRDMVALAPVIEWLRQRQRDVDDPVITIWCQRWENDLHGKGSGGWTDPQPKGGYVMIAEMLSCLQQRGMTYVNCGSRLGEAARRAAEHEWSEWVWEIEKDGVTTTGSDPHRCEMRWNSGFMPQDVPSGTADPKRVTIEDIARWLVLAPVLPAGVQVILQTVPRLWPVLCVLRKGAPCPASPLSPPGGIPQPPTGDAR